MCSHTKTLIISFNLHTVIKYWRWYIVKWFQTTRQSNKEKMTTNFNESYKYCIVKWVGYIRSPIVLYFTFDMKFYTYFPIENIFFLRKPWYWSRWDIKKGVCSFLLENGHNSFWNQFYDLYSTFKFTKRRAKFKYAFIEKVVAEKARIFFCQ